MANVADHAYGKREHRIERDVHYHVDMLSINVASYLTSPGIYACGTNP